jgi:predicted PurR-regulated permease PerM
MANTLRGMGEQRKKFEAKMLMQARYGMIAASVVGVLFLIYVARGALFPVATGWFLAYLLNPTIDKLEKKGISRARAIAFLLGFTLLFLSSVLILFLPYFGREIFTMTARLLDRSDVVFDWIRSFGIKIPDSFSETFKTYGSKLQEIAPQVAGWLATHIGDAFSQLGAFVGLFLNGLLIPLFAYYFLLDFHQIDERLISFIPHSYRPKSRDFIDKLDNVLGSFFYGQMLVGLAQGTLFAIGLSLLGVKFGAVIGILAGLFSIIPYLGYAVGILLSMIMALLEFEGWGTLAGIGILFFSVNLLENFYLTPNLVGDKVGLSPVAVIIALLFFSELLGMTGLVIAVPTTAVLRILWTDLEAYYRESQFFQRGQRPFAKEEELAALEKLVSVLPCICGGSFQKQEVSRLELPLAGIKMKLLCLQCGREQDLRLSTRIIEPTSKAPATAAAASNPQNTSTNLAQPPEPDTNAASPDPAAQASAEPAKPEQPEASTPPKNNGDS